MNSRRRSSDRKVESGGDASVRDRDRLVELSQQNIGIGEQIAGVDVPRIEINCAHKIAFSLLPFSLPPVQVSREGKKRNAVRHRRPGQGELFFGPMVVAPTTKIIVCHA